MLIGNHAHEILECESFETIVDYMKLELPNKVVTETDDVSVRALNMDVKQQLNLYEVEYQLLNEEMIDLRQNKEKYEKQEVAMETVKQKMIEMKKELLETKKMVKTLSSSLEEANKKNQVYESKIEALIKENRALSVASIDQTDGLNDNGRVNWSPLPSPPTGGRELNDNMGRAFSLDSSFLSSEENIACEFDL